MTTLVPVTDMVDIAEAHFGYEAARHRKAAEAGTCGTCCRFERNDIDPECGIGLCVGTWSHKRACRKCRSTTYISELYWEWTVADRSARECDGYEPCTGYAGLQ